MPKPRKPQRTAKLTPEQIQRLADKQQEQERRLHIGRLVKQARKDGAGQTQQEFADKMGRHKNTIAGWEQGRFTPELYFREIEEATGKPPGWFEYQLDPYSRILEMADALDAINRKLDSLETLIRKKL